MADQIVLAPGLAADDQRRTVAVAPFQTTPLGSKGPSRQVLQ